MQTVIFLTHGKRLKEFNLSKHCHSEQNGSFVKNLGKKDAPYSTRDTSPVFQRGLYESCNLVKRNNARKKQ
jgi:hypothetical protein